MIYSFCFFFFSANACPQIEAAISEFEAVQPPSPQNWTPVQINATSPFVTQFFSINFDQGESSFTRCLAKAPPF